MNNNISFLFPLSDGTLGTLYLPPQMSRDDAKRLKRMINAMYLNATPPPQGITETEEERTE